MADLPSISIIIPTLDSEQTLARCLESIRMQNYPANAIEILVCDGGSHDRTKEIADTYKVDHILENPLKTGESGKAVGLKRSKNELVAFIDSDNFLIGNNWLQQMAAPFLKDPQIILTEPLFFHYDDQSSLITRYCALMGLNDPFCYYTGNFDRWNFALKTWTKFSISIHKEQDWFWFELSARDQIPTIGANGTLYRRETLKELPPSDYFFDVDILHRLVAIQPRRMAKVRTEIFHWYCSTFKDFSRKQTRRIRDYLYHSEKNERIGHSRSYSYFGIVRFALAVFFVFPCFYTSLRGCLRRPSASWFLHWPLSALTLYIYTLETIRYGCGQKADKMR